MHRLALDLVVCFWYPGLNAIALIDFSSPPISISLMLSLKCKLSYDQRSPILQLFTLVSSFFWAQKSSFLLSA